MCSPRRRTKVNTMTSMCAVVIGAALLSTGCIEGVTQVAGTGATYTTRCSAEMEIDGVEYYARCTPASCEASYHSGGVSHVVVAIDPGKKIVGYAERACIQDLSQATTMFQPAIEAEAEARRAEEAAEAAAEPEAEAVDDGEEVE